MYMYGVCFATEKNLCVPSKLADGRLSHTFISQNRAFGEIFFDVAQRERVEGETFTLVSHSVS